MGWMSSNAMFGGLQNRPDRGSSPVLSRIESGSSALDVQRLDLSGVVYGAWNHHSPRGEKQESASRHAFAQCLGHNMGDKNLPGPHVVWNLPDQRESNSLTRQGRCL